MITEDEKMGYIPSKTNKIFSRLMDGGKLLTAEVRNVDYYLKKITRGMDKNSYVSLELCSYFLLIKFLYKIYLLVSNLPSFLLTLLLWYSLYLLY